ncbi:MAG: ATPase, partial [Oscillospiraceae bacterium]
MNINENLDLIDDILDAAWSVPLSGGKCMIDIDKVREIIEDIRLNMPSEIKQAKLIVEDRKSIVEDAKKEANSIIEIANERSKKLVDNNEIVKQAQERAKEI